MLTLDRYLFLSRAVQPHVTLHFITISLSIHNLMPMVGIMRRPAVKPSRYSSFHTCVSVPNSTKPFSRWRSPLSSPFPDPKSEVSTPLLSVPPNVTFTEGLTPQVVSRGVPIWACQARRQRVIAARAGAGASAGATVDGDRDGHGRVDRNGEDAQDIVGHDVLPAAGKGGIRHQSNQSPASPRKLQQVLSASVWR